MGGGGKGGSSGGGDTTIRYAPYLEDAHQDALEMLEGMVNSAIGQSPFDSYDVLDFPGALVGTDYTLTDYPSLWDMYGKFMSGLDVETLWSQLYTRITRGPEIAAAVEAQSRMLQDEVDTTVMPRFLGGMRDINAVHSSAFVTGRAIIEDAHIKAVSKFAGDIRIESFKVSANMWAKHLDWNQAVIVTYQDMMKLYFMSHMDMEELRLRFAAKHEMWDINLMEHVRAMLGALGGGTPITDQNQPSQLQKSLGGALSGAAAGASIGGPIGAGIGGILGLGASFF